VNFHRRQLAMVYLRGGYFFASLCRSCKSRVSPDGRENKSATPAQLRLPRPASISTASSTTFRIPEAFHYSYKKDSATTISSRKRT